MESQGLELKVGVSGAFWDPGWAVELCLCVGSSLLPCHGHRLASDLWRWAALGRSRLQGLAGWLARESFLGVVLCYWYGVSNWFCACGLGLGQAVCILSEGNLLFSSPRSSRSSLALFSSPEELWMLSCGEPTDCGQLVLSSALW